MITRKRQQGWEFAFLGADIDAYASGVVLGIKAGNILNYKGSQSKQAFRTVAVSTVCYANDPSSTDDLFDEDDS
jgi:hypothetical protein